jgi:hypothetical protein
MKTYRIRASRSGRAFAVRALDERDLKLVLRNCYACTVYIVLDVY